MTAVILFFESRGIQIPEQSFKERVRLTMISMAKLYKEKYVDYEYLICSGGYVKNHYYIIDAAEDNLQHLTGVHSLISPKEFFEKSWCRLSALLLPSL